MQVENQCKVLNLELKSINKPQTIMEGFQDQEMTGIGCNKRHFTTTCSQIDRVQAQQVSQSVLDMQQLAAEEEQSQILEAKLVQILEEECDQKGYNKDIKNQENQIQCTDNTSRDLLLVNQQIKPSTKQNSVKKSRSKPIKVTVENQCIEQNNDNLAPKICKPKRSNNGRQKKTPAKPKQVKQALQENPVEYQNKNQALVNNINDQITIKPKFLTVEDEVKRTKLQMGCYIKQMIGNGYWKDGDLVLENVKKYISSQKLRTLIKKQKTLKVMQQKVIPVDYTEITYEKKHHPIDLVGLYSKTYASSYFQGLSESDLDSKIKDIAIQLDQEKNKKLKLCLKESLREDQLKLIFLYDQRVPSQIPNSCNSESLKQINQSMDQRLIGIASYNFLEQGKLGSFNVKNVFPKNHQKRNIRKITLALQASLSNLRSHMIFVKAKKKDQDLFEKLGFISTEASKNIQEMFDIKDEKNLATLTYISTKVDRDLKHSTKQNETQRFTKRAAKIKNVIEEYKKYYVKPVQEQKRVIKRMSTEYAILSDQAETPDWVFRKIRKVLLITKSMLLDVFIYQPNWNTKEFYDGFKKPWPLDNIIYVNPPFSQGILALQKCMEFFSQGGQCVLLLPTLSIIQQDLYVRYISKCTMRDDLRLFPFKGYDFALMKHIVLLYFIQPDFLIELNEKKKYRSQDQVQFTLSVTGKRIWSLKRESKMRGRIPKMFSANDIDEMVEMFQQKKSFHYIMKYRHIQFRALKKILYSRLGCEVVDKQLKHFIRIKQDQIRS